MRVYLSATVRSLAAAQAAGVVAANPVAAQAVTPALREWYTEGDLEELEHAAFLAAARESLRLLAADPSAPRRRVVVSADVPDGPVQAVADADERSAVVVRADVPLSAVASVHVDDDEAVGDVAAAVDALALADAGDEDAEFTVENAEGHDLMWFDVSELGDVAGLA